MKNKIVIYTAIFGGCDDLIEPKFIPDNCDFVCFTDSDFKSDIWDVRKVTPVYEQPVRNSRYYKTKPHIYLSEYEISIWMDGTFVLEKDINDLIHKYLSDANMACFNHINTDIDKLKSVYQQAEYIFHLGKINSQRDPSKGISAYKDDPKLIEKQIEKYKKEGFPDDKGLVISGVLFRRHNEKDCIETMESWWKEIKYHSRRDQLSFNYVAWKNNFKFNYLEGHDRTNHYFNFMKHNKHNKR